MPVLLMSRLRSPLRVDEGAHLAPGRVIVRFGRMPQSPCRTAVGPLAALQVDHGTSRTAAQTNGRFHVICQILAALPKGRSPPISSISQA